MWYSEILGKGAERFETKYYDADAATEADLPGQMSAFRITEEEIEQMILSLGFDLDPESWDTADRESRHGRSASERSRS